MHFYNQVLLLVVDLAFGILAGMVFSYYHQWFSNTAEDAHNWLLFGLQVCDEEQGKSNDSRMVLVG